MACDAGVFRAAGTGDPEASHQRRPGGGRAVGGVRPGCGRGADEAPVRRGRGTRVRAGRRGIRRTAPRRPRGRPGAAAAGRPGAVPCPKTFTRPSADGAGGVACLGRGAAGGEVDARAPAADILTCAGRYLTNSVLSSMSWQPVGGVRRGGGRVGVAGSAPGERRASGRAARLRPGARRGRVRPVPRTRTPGAPCHRRTPARWRSVQAPPEVSAPASTCRPRAARRTRGRPPPGARGSR